VIGVIGVACRRKQPAIVAQVPARTDVGQRRASRGADRAIRRTRRLRGCRSRKEEQHREEEYMSETVEDLRA
jgi:hypothetical protein